MTTGWHGESKRHSIARKYCRASAAGSGFLARQDLIDYYIEEDERQMKIRGREMRSPIFNFPKEWHSKYKTSEPTVVV